MKQQKAKERSSKRRLRIALLLLAVTVVLFAAWFFVYGRTKVPKFIGPVEHVTVGNVGEYSTLSIIAQKRGYFKEYGLEVDMKEYVSGPPAVADVLSGKVDMATAADYVGVTYSFSNPKLRILTTQLRVESFFMTARRDHGISTAADLKGKKIGMTRNTAGEFYLGNFLALNQLRFQDVSVINAPPSRLADMLEKGQVDAIVSFDPHIYNAQKQLGTNALVWSMQGDEKLSSLLYGSEDLVKNRPEVVERYLQALLEAQKFAQYHNKEAMRIVEAYLHYDDAYMQRIWPRISIDVSLDEYLLISLEEKARWAIENGTVNASQSPNYLKVIYFNGLEAVDPDAVTIIH